MSGPPITPFDPIFAQLTQGMSAAVGTRIVNLVGYEADAQHTRADRVMWIPRGIATEQQHFELPGATTPWRQGCPFDVSIYGSSLARLYEMHALLVAWLDLIVGPPQGGPPSDDAAPAVLRGTVDLAALLYPYAGLMGLSISVTAPGARSLALPASPVASPQAIATAINLAAQAASGPVQYVLARIVKDGAHRYLELLLESNPLGPPAATLTIDPTAANSACAALGFSSADDNITATGAAPTTPYRPGYYVGPSEEPWMRGGDAASQGWGMIVPVTLYQPIVSIQFITGVIAAIELQIAATGGDAPDEVVVDVTASAA